MPMPRLLKRLSQKSLRKRSPSLDSNSAPDNQRTQSSPEPIPPLPPPKTPHINGSFRVMTPPSTLRSLERPSTPSPLPNGGGSADKPHANGSELTLPPSLPPANGYGKPDDDLSRELAEAWNVASRAPKVTKTDKVLQTLGDIENSVLGAQTNQGNSTMMVTGITTVLEVTGGMQAIEQGVNSFMEGSAVLMNALDEVSKLHPFIGVAVMAFKAVWTLEMKRRENDKKIIALHVEMRDMMGVLVQLKGVKDVEAVAPDGSSIKGRMQALVQGTADDIKACANACDTYSKKKLVVKVIKGPIWEGRLLKFVGLFTKRRSEFESALTVHTSLGVDAANKTLGDVDKTTQEMNAKMDMMMKMFQSFVLPEEKEVARLIDQKGGAKACQESDKILKELNDFENRTGSQATGGSHAGRKGGSKLSDLEDLKDDLHIDPDVAMEKNMSVFSRKFEVQKRQIIDELSRVVQREGDRVISAVTAGPHDKIIDPDVHKIWKEMGWRGSVKSRHFVMALRDYFQEKWGSDGQPTEPGTTTVVDQNKPGEWALAYLNVVRLQPITEAFDDDASGFITVAEVNTFTTSRPLEWSLPHWIAYWAIGWHQSMAKYVEKIRELIAKMFAILPNILPANKSSVNDYIESVYTEVTTLESSLNVCYVNDALQERFKSYVEAEEARLQGNLEAVDYDIDAMDTLALVTGQGRIEKFVLPLLYLLLKRHFEIFRICQNRVVHHDELWDAADTLQWVFDAVTERFEVLKSIFKQQKLDLGQQFKTFSHGLYEYTNEPNGLWDPKVVQESELPEYPYDDSTEAKDVDIAKVLNYPLDQEELDFSAYDLPTNDARAPDSFQPSSPLNAILGQWNGFPYWPASSSVPYAGMMAMSLRASSVEGQNRYFEASGRSGSSDFTISGECSPDNTGDTVKFTFKRVFPTRYAPIYYEGSWDAATDSLTGTWGMDPDLPEHDGIFIFKRTAPEYLCFRPSPAVFQANKAKALWSFATSAIRYKIRRQSWSWSFFRERKDNRKRFIELHIRSFKYGRPLDVTESLELGRLKQTLTAADSRFYNSLSGNRIRITAGHGVYCDSCGGSIGGARISCLICQMKDTFNTVDFCEAPGCIAERVTREDLTRPHLPTHDLVKVRRVVHTRQFGKTYREAKEALKKSRAFFAGDEAEGSDSDESNNALEVDHGADTPVLKPGPACAVCKSPVTQPCWNCVQCSDDSFICNDCDAKSTASFGNHDIYTHDLVRCQEPVEDMDTSMEDRIAELEQRFARHEATMDERLGRLESKVDDRLSRVETLLERVLEKIGAEPT